MSSRDSKIQCAVNSQHTPPADESPLRGNVPLPLIPRLDSQLTSKPKSRAALGEAASARLASSEPRVVPCAAQTSEQYSQDG